MDSQIFTCYSIVMYVFRGVGGSGCSSWARTLAGYGSPDGGSGGSGGSIYLLTSNSEYEFNLNNFVYRGGAGGRGSSDDQEGCSGADRMINIPAGTIVKEIIGKSNDTGNYIYRPVCELNSAGLKLLVSAGGRGGLGNKSFKTNYRNNNSFSTAGAPGENRWIELELKTIADCGLVGYPNAGKAQFIIGRNI
jgi:GTP-binding protein